MKKILLLFFIFFSSQSFAQDKTIDSLKQLLSTAKEDTNKVKLLISIAGNYIWDKPDSAILYGFKARELSKQLNYIDGQLEVVFTLSEALSAKGYYSKALEIDLEALNIAEKTGIGNRSIMVWIGGVYFYSGDYTKALDYYLKAKINRFHSDKLSMGFVGETYYYLGHKDSALFYLKKAYQLDQNDSSHWSVPYFYMALIESKEGKLKESLNNYKIGLLYAKGVSLDIANGYNGIANVFKKLNQRDSSIFYAKKAIRLAQQESLTPKVIDASALLTELYIKINTDSAFKYQRIMLSAKDSLFSEEKVKQFQNLSFNEQIKQQELQQKLQQAQMKFRNRLNIYLLLAGLLILLIVAGGLLRRNIYRKKAIALLGRQKEEIQRTLTQLKSTQSQLIQSEKMASLGELTAGIAHEIQNPLNFVNNFSDVNKELLQELKEEADKGNIEDVKAIADDVIGNEEKINHHGNRAGDIVKGMLQHSRTSTGVKEATDINALADEYLRLSYHGLRAKDKNFNATMKTDFDESIGKINIIPQDIGRVLLNLFNNAFYEVNEQKSSNPISYQPTVFVRTQKCDDKIQITVRDNGNGIPQKIIDKIFQPFFTTKPTGQGTGLGLSLSYDIIKAHGGEIKVASKESVGSEFIIQLPIV